MALLDLHPVEPAADPTFAALVDLLVDVTGLDLGDATPDALLDDLGFDSLARVEAVVALGELGIEIPEALAAELRTVGDLHALWARPRPAPPMAGQWSANPRRRTPLRGATVRLEPMRDGDAGWAYGVHTHPDQLARYRTRGATPSPEAFHQLLWQGVVAQFVVVAHTSTRIGLVSLIDPDWRNRHAHLAVVADPAWRGSGLVLEGLALLIDWSFEQFDLRKLYLEALDGNLAPYRSGIGRRFEIEGVLRGHEFVDGHWEDLVVAAVTREAWLTRR